MKVDFNIDEDLQRESEPFILSIRENRNDWNRRLIYSDWLEDHGQINMAYTQRWMSKNKVCPSFRYFTYRGNKAKKEWAWYPLPNQFGIPYSIYYMIAGKNQERKLFKSEMEAEYALCEALCKLQKLMEV